MKLSRFFKHLCATKRSLRSAFPKAALNAIEAKIHESEALHAGEIRFAVETSLDGWSLWRGQTARERAVDVFSNLRVWDTEDNSGLLIYVLLADRAVEIVADRGIHAKVGAAEWRRICSDIETQFSRQQFSQGVISGIEQMTQHLKQHFPAQGNDVNELSNKAVQL